MTQIYEKKTFDNRAMELDFDRIERLMRIRAEKSELSCEEKALAFPVLRDMSLIREIYRIFTGILNERDCPPNPRSVIQRKKFIFIILYLYSPGALAGGKMRQGLREEMSRVLGIRNGSVISDNCDDVVFLYRHYRDFSEDIGLLYTGISRRLEAEGLVK